MIENQRLTDLDSLFKFVFEDKESFVKLINIFLDTFPQIVEQLDQSVSKGNFIEIANRAHALKGSLLLVGAIISARKIEVIETAAKNCTLISDLYFKECSSELNLIIDEVKKCPYAI